MSLFYYDGAVVLIVLAVGVAAAAATAAAIPAICLFLSLRPLFRGQRLARAQALSQDLLKTTLEIPFSVPPYMSLLARSVATLEGIALIGDPGYQMITQVSAHNIPEPVCGGKVFSPRGQVSLPVIFWGIIFITK